MPTLHLHKMLSSYTPDKPVSYSLQHADQRIQLNPSLGRRVALHFSGQIHCVACGRKITKSYQQGHCFPCTQKLASCDLCIVKPELCHFHKGTCREPSWGQLHCMIPHVLYIANSSGLKVGITRAHQKITRWIDQGAIQALAVASVSKRLDAGILESFLKKDYADRTDWRAMLRGGIEALDLISVREEVLGALPFTLAHEALEETPAEIIYPVLEYPTKVKSLNLDKTPKIEGTLLGMKGQYVILDTGVINIRSYSGYEVSCFGFEESSPVPGHANLDQDA